VGDQKKDMGSAGRLLGSSKENPMVFSDEESEEFLAEIFVPAEKVSEGQSREGSTELPSLKSGLKDSIFAPVEKEEKRSSGKRISGERKLPSTTALKRKRSSNKDESDGERDLGIKRGEVNATPGARESKETQKKLLTVEEAGGLLVEDSLFETATTNSRPRLQVGSDKDASKSRKSSPSQATVSDFQESFVSLSKKKEPNGKSVTGRLEREASKQKGVVVKSAQRGRCCECSGKVGIVGYRSEYGPRTLCHRCYDQTRRPGKVGSRNEPAWCLHKPITRQAKKLALRASQKPLEKRNRKELVWPGPCSDCRRKAAPKWYSSEHGPRSLCESCYYKRRYRKRVREQQAEGADYNRSRFEVREESSGSDLGGREDGRGGGKVRNKSETGGVKWPEKAADGFGKRNSTPSRTSEDLEKQGECAFDDGRRSDAMEGRGNLASEKRTYFVPRFVK
jgi:hypothetical protein